MVGPDKTKYGVNGEQDGRKKRVEKEEKYRRRKVNGRKTKRKRKNKGLHYKYALRGIEARHHMLLCQYH
jgi:hypothetical protein